MARIADKTKKTIMNKIEALLNRHHFDINEAYLKFGTDDPDFAITFKAVIKPAANANHVLVKSSFPPGPNQKDEMEGYADEDQLDLFDDTKPKIVWEYPYVAPGSIKGPPELGFHVWRKRKTVY